MNKYLPTILFIVIYIIYILIIIGLAKRNRPKKGYKLKFFKFIFLGFPFDSTTALKISHNIFLFVCPIMVILNALCINNIELFNNVIRFINGPVWLLFLLNILFNINENF